ncbi:MAG: aspartate aminotransferase family protein [Pseudomonadota bacterium]|nr:aspartate aminotransferase family protein [Pseudomonadota bacterium]
MSAIMTTYSPSKLSFERGNGPYLYTADGQEYLDFCSGIAVSSLGHGHPQLINALKKQADRLLHYSNLYQIPEQERAAQRLATSTFASSVFFCNSGAEAVECGIKVVRRYHHENGAPTKNRIITCKNSFHGRSISTLSAAKQEKHMNGFAPMLDGFDQAPFGEVGEIRKGITDQTAAILIEPIQGEGGVNAADEDYLHAVRELADEYGILLFLDEVQTGIGRTGKLFAYQWTNIVPDVLSTAKGLGGGFPVGACLTNSKVGSAMTAGSHGSTFGGNPMAMAATNTVLDVVLETKFLKHVQEMSQLLEQKLNETARAYPEVLGEVRGKGLLLGVQCKVENLVLVKLLEELCLLTVAAGDNVVRFIPPLIIENQHIEMAILSLETACKQLKDREK